MANTLRGCDCGKFEDVAPRPDEHWIALTSKCEDLIAPTKYEVLICRKACIRLKPNGWNSVKFPAGFFEAKVDHMKARDCMPKDKPTGFGSLFIKDCKKPFVKVNWIFGCDLFGCSIFAFDLIMRQTIRRITLDEVDRS